MTIPAIQVESLSKVYRLGTQQSNCPLGEQKEKYRTLRETIVSLATLPWKRLQSSIRPPKDFFALKDVSFEIQPGEVVGIIGRNGAGKSTLLKVLSRIVEPTTGLVQVRGRLASLLEVGTGFHPELSGRENIFLNGSILGMSHREISRHFDEIVAFSEVETFLDTPVKRYSSGMYVRLGFAIAAFLNPEIMLVDEVLAVGDQSFQKKCLGKMSEVGKGGRTVLFVSHNMSAVENLCQRTIWIADGQVKEIGDTKQVIRNYLNSFGTQQQQAIDLASIEERSGTGNVRFSKMEFLSLAGDPLKILHCGEGLRIRFTYECMKDVANLHFGVRIYTLLGTLINDVHTWTTGQAIPQAPEGQGTIDLEIDFLNLMPGSYLLSIWASSFNGWHDVIENVAKLEIEPSDFYGTGRGVEARFGTIFLPFRWVAKDNGNTANTKVQLNSDGVNGVFQHDVQHSAERSKISFEKTST